jgi:hypothetical protein
VQRLAGASLDSLNLGRTGCARSNASRQFPQHEGNQDLSRLSVLNS